MRSHNGRQESLLKNYGAWAEFPKTGTRGKPKKPAMYLIMI